MVLHPQADVKQVPPGVVQAAEVHRHAQLHALPTDVFKLLLFIGRGVSLARQGVACAAGRQQVACQVAAVNGRHISGLQHLQRFGLVPVIQMPVVLGQLVHGAQRRLQARHHVAGADPAKLARAGHSQQVQADVGR